MSDEDEYEYEYDSDASDEAMVEGSNDGQNNSDNESFEYTDEEPEADGIDVVLENAYYNAKGLRESDMSEAAEAFDKVITMEHDALLAEKPGSDSGTAGEPMTFGPWSFKALKQLVKVRLRTGELDRARESYHRLLDGISSPHCDGVSPNAIEKGIQAMLERVSSLFQANRNLSTSTKGSAPIIATTNNLARHVYDGTLTLFHPNTGSCPNERLWCKTNLKYGQLLYEMNETPKLQLVIRDLLKTMHHDEDGSNTTSNNNSNASSSTNLMEIYALQIQLHSRQKDNKKLRQIFAKAMRVQGGIPHPRTLALIQELGGKMHMASREFEAARKTFFQAFKSYDEAGDVARLRCLKYLVMASMLHASSINPFDSQEVRPYRNDPEIKAITNLVEAFQGNEIERFEGILARNEGRVMDDEFIREHIGDLKRTIRRQVMTEVIRPYTRISLKAISKALNGIPIVDVESLLVGLILDGKAKGRIDQVNGVLIKEVDRGVQGGGGEGHEEESEGNESEEPNSSSGGGNSGRDAGDARRDNALSSVPALPAWGTGSVELQTFTAMNDLMGELEKLTLAVTASASRTRRQVY